MGVPALIGLGSNLGDRKATLDGAIAALRATPGIEVRAVSTYHEIRAVGGPSGQGAFLNAAAALETSLEPEALLHALQAIEASARRERLVHWGPRTLDLDILLFSDRVINCDGLSRRLHVLQIPHPLLPFRRFALAPAAEVAPEAVHPLIQRTIRELLENLDRRPSYVAFVATFPGSPRGNRLFVALVTALGATGVSRCGEDWFTREMQDVGLFDMHSPIQLPELERTRRQAVLAGRCQAILESWADGLRRDRWEEAQSGHRWIVTDFWLEMVPFSYPLTDAGWFDRHRGDWIEPTFVVIPQPHQKQFLIDTRLDRSRADQPGLDPRTPIFVPPSVGDEDLVAEVVAMCDATRAGTPS